jgi:hypothetical protein
MLEGRPHNNPRRFLNQIPATGHQLLLVVTERRRKGLRLPSGGSSQRPSLPRQSRYVQQVLFEVARDYTRFDFARDAELDNPTLVVARGLSATQAELRGWSSHVLRGTDRGLINVLSHHQPGETIRYSEILPLAAHRRVIVGRVAAILEQMGLLDDDRESSFELWLARRTADLAPQIADDVQAWIRQLRYGGPRSKPRARATSWAYLAAVQPLLVDWSATHQHLREITRSDIQSALAPMRGNERNHTLHVLRSLFRFCRREKLIFRNPTVGIKPADEPRRQPLPIGPDAYEALAAAAVTVEQQLILALVVVHAATRTGLRELTVDDIDVAGRRITIGEHPRPLDDLTHRLLLRHLDDRRQRWPQTTNRHVFISQSTAYGTGPASIYWLHTRVQDLNVTPGRLRIDRQLDEALISGGDALRVASVFGITEQTAVRYAEAARAILDSTHRPQ